MSHTLEPQTEGVLTLQIPSPAALNGNYGLVLTPQQDHAQHVTVVELPEGQTDAEEKCGSPRASSIRPPDTAHTEQAQYVRWSKKLRSWLSKSH